MYEAGAYILMGFFARILLSLYKHYSKHVRFTTPYRKLIGWSVFLVPMLYGYLFINLTNANSDDLLAYILHFALAPLIISIVGYRILSALQTKQTEYDQLYGTKEEQAKRKAFVEMVAAGQWTFPAKEFYLLCKENSVTPDDQDEYKREKFSKLAQYFFEQYNIPEESRQIYAAKLVDYYRTVEAQILQEQAAAEAYKNTVHAFTPDEAEAAFLSGIHTLANATGTQKRAIMLQNQATALQLKFNANCNSIDDNKRLTYTWMSGNAVKYQKEADWAIMGGAASALGSPAAGIAAAIDTQTKNQQIRDHNAQLQNASMQMVSWLQENRKRLQAENHNLFKQIENIQKEIALLTTKVVFSSVATADISEHISIKRVKVEKTKSGVLRIQAFLDFALPENMLPISNCVVDGTIKAEVWCDDVHVGDILFALPLEGAAVQAKGVEVTGFCPNAYPDQRTYTVKKATGGNLWLMDR